MIVEVESEWMLDPYYQTQRNAARQGAGELSQRRGEESPVPFS
jgi:hypothetical protein